jgi:hypothetical protein
MIKIEPPKKAYKLFKVRKKQKGISSLFIDNKKVLPVNVWLKAEDHKTKGFKHRPGWHTMKTPLAPHLTNNGRQWWEVEICNKKTFNRPSSQGGIWFLSEWIRLVKPYEVTKKKKKKIR